MILSIYEAGLSQTMYYSFFGIGFIVAYSFLIWLGKKIGIGSIKVILSLLVGSVLVLSSMWLVQSILKPLSQTVPIMNSYLNNMARGFLFIPLIALLSARIFRIPCFKICTLYSFSQTIIWGFASIGCLFAGCCHGYPCQIGIYNVITRSILFPTQLINSIGLLSIAILLFIRIKKYRYTPDGKELPIMLILVGLLRFATEFLMDNEKIVLGLSSLSFDALAIFTLGVIGLFIANRKSNINITQSLT